jgi:hypothetical protein
MKIYWVWVHENERTWACHSKRLKKVEHAKKNMWEFESAIKRTKKLEHVAKKMKASTREGMIIQCCMGVRCKHWAFRSSWWSIIYGFKLTFN